MPSAAPSVSALAGREQDSPVQRLSRSGNHLPNIHSNNMGQGMTAELYPSSSFATSSMSDVENLIHDRIWNAVLVGKLEPGTKLPEEEIGDAFRVSRTVVRKVLVIMEQEGIVTLLHNRGAYITVPSEQAAHESLEILRLISTQAVRGLADEASRETHDLLHRHHAAQQEADERNLGTRRHLAVELFILLAHLHGNRVMVEIQRCHAVLLNLALMVYQDTECVPAYHGDQQAIIAAIAAGDSDKAGAALDLYLSRIRQSLRFSDDGNNGSKLKSILLQA